MGFPGKKYFDIYTLLQLLLNSLIIYRYYTYEVNNSFENVVLRSSDKNWFCYKLIGLLFGVIFVRLVFWALAYLFYHGLITIRLSYFIYPIIHHFLVGIIIITICNLFKNQIMRFILIIIFSILTSIYFHLWYIIILIGLIILNYRDFNFQRLQ